jgi:hypothetical protein
MNFKTATNLQFQEGKIGQLYLDTLSLPSDTFPHEGSWNQFHALTPDEASALRRHTASSPPIEDNKSSPLTPGSSAHQLASFSKLNAGAVRFSPSHLLWKSEDILALHQRQSFGSALMMLTVYREDGTFSDPFLCVTGPVATPLQGETFDTRTIFNLDEESPLPLVHGDIRLPELIAPTTVSLSATSRDWIETTAPSQLLLQARSQGQFLTILDSTPLHSTVPILDATDSTWTRLQSEKVFLKAGLWGPAVVSASGDLKLDKPTINNWTKTSIAPPDPQSHSDWPIGSTADPIPTRVTTGAYRPSLTAAMAHMQPPSETPGKFPGFLLVPRFLRFPISALLPVGLVLDPNEVTALSFRCLVTAMAAPRQDGLTKWLDNVMLDTWLQAAANDPTAFAVPAFTHSHFVSSFPATNVFALSIRLHQEWSLLSQLIWDHAFATATGSRDNNMALRLRNYAQSLVAANNFAVGDSAMSQTWGYIDSIYSHPFLARLRSPTDASLGEHRGKWTAFSEASDADLPAYIQPIPCLQITLPPRNQPTCPPIHSTLDGPSPPDGGTLHLLDDPLDMEAAPTDPLLARSGKRSLAYDPFAASPSPAKTRTRRTTAAGDADRTLASSLAHEVEVVAVITDTPLDDFDPVAMAIVVSAKPMLADPWSLPYQLTGQNPMPFSDNPTCSAPMATAIRQSTPSLTEADTQKSGGFEFSRELMITSAHQSRDVVNRIAFWLSFRCSQVGDPPFQTITLPAHKFADDYHFAPGRLNPALLPLFQAAYGKLPTTHVFTNLVTWFTQQCAEAAAETTCAGPECRIDPGFFTTPIVQAIQNFAFKSGNFYAAPDSIITPWHFLRSLPEFQTQAIARIPATGLRALQLIDIICNIDFMFHLLSRDYNDFGTVGTGHSPYSRFSPLSGHLLLLAAFFQQRRIQSFWDTSLSPSARLSYTKAIFIAMSDLFAIYDSWQAPKYQPALTFNAARVGHETHLVLLSPNIDPSGRRKAAALKEWRDSIAVFSLARLQCEVPTEGLFAKPTPSFFAPLPPVSAAPARPGSHEAASASSSNQASSLARSGTNWQASTARSTSSNSRNRVTSSVASSGESTNGDKAREPLLKRTHDFVKSLGEVVHEVNATLAPALQLKVPNFIPSGSSRPIMLCFRFASVGGPGCTRGSRCRYAHIDLADAARARDHVPAEFYRKLLALLGHAEVARYYSPTAAFTSFLGSR